MVSLKIGVHVYECVYESGTEMLAPYSYTYSYTPISFGGLALESELDRFGAHKFC